MNATIDAIDRAIIAATQDGLPLCRDPYGEVAHRLGLSRHEVMARLSAMLGAGIIRRIGIVANHYGLGVRANAMSVWDIADERVDDIGERIGALDFVSHCYRRPRALPHWPYNLFAMVHGRDRDQVLAKVERIARLIGDAGRGHDVLFSTRILKKKGLRIAPATEKDHVPPKPVHA